MRWQTIPSSRSIIWRCASAGSSPSTISPSPQAAATLPHSLARTAQARRRSSTASRGFTNRPAGAFSLSHGPMTDSAVDSLTASPRRFSPPAKPSTFLLERMADHEIAAKARVARTFQNIRLFQGMTLLENLIVAQHRTLMKASGLTFGGLFGSRTIAKQKPAPCSSPRSGSMSSASRHAPTNQRATSPTAPAPPRDRARNVHRSVLLCLDEPAAGLNNRESADLTRLLRAIRAETGVSICSSSTTCPSSWTFPTMSSSSNTAARSPTTPPKA